MLTALLISLVFVGLVIANTLPSFLQPVIRKLSDSGSSSQLEDAERVRKRVKRHLSAIDWQLDDEDKRHINEAMSTGKDIDIVYVSTPMSMKDSTITPSDLLDYHFSSMENYPPALKAEALEALFDFNTTVVEDYIRTNRALESVFSNVQEKYGRRLVQSQPYELPSSSDARTENKDNDGDSWEREFASISKGSSNS